MSAEKAGGRKPRDSHLPDEVWRPERMQGLARCIAKAGYATRAQAEAIVRAGRVKLDGQLTTDPSAPVSPENTIHLDDQPLLRLSRRYFAFHKPVKVVTAASDRGGRRQITEFFPPEVPGLRPAGRLDANTSGLILVSNDHRWNTLAAKSRGLEKEYQIQITGPLTGVEINIITAGMHLPILGWIRPTDIRVIERGEDYTTLRLIIVDGKNRQVRRIFSSLRHTIVYLRRIRIGPVQLGNLPTGRLRALTPEEIEAIHRTAS